MQNIGLCFQASIFFKEIDLLFHKNKSNNHQHQHPFIVVVVVFFVLVA